MTLNFVVIQIFNGVSFGMPLFPLAAGLADFTV
jgi:hypothetical protein